MIFSLLCSFVFILTLASQERLSILLMMGFEFRCFSYFVTPSIPERAHVVVPVTFVPIDIAIGVDILNVGRAIQ